MLQPRPRCRATRFPAPTFPARRFPSAAAG